MPVTGSFASSPPIAPTPGLIPDQDVSAIQAAKNGLFVDTASGIYLTRLGQNYGIPRPAASPFDDETYRLIVQALAFLPKTLLSTLYYLMQAVFDSQAAIVAAGARPWRIYEVNANEIVVEIPFDLLGTSNDQASYLHGYPGVVLSGATTTVFSFFGDARVAASSLPGLGASIWSGTAFEEKVISSTSYSTSTGQTTATVGSPYSFVPAPGAAFFINVPGDGILSFRGDYLSPTWYASGVATSTSANSVVDSGASMTVNQHAGKFLRMGGGTIFYPILGNSATAFSVGANGGVPPVGPYAVVSSPVDADEESDTSTTPPHADRVYVTGDGKFEIVKQYLLSVVRASGVVVRLEKV